MYPFLSTMKHGFCTVITLDTLTATTTQYAHHAFSGMMSILPHIVNQALNADSTID